MPMGFLGEKMANSFKWEYELGKNCVISIMPTISISIQLVNSLAPSDQVMPSDLGHCGSSKMSG